MSAPTPQTPEISEGALTPEDDVRPPIGDACPNCGTPHDLDDRFCAGCGQAVVPRSTAPETASAGSETADAAARKHIRCENCGAEIKTDPDQRSYTCPFCDSTYVVELAEAETGRQPPEFVIGFAVTRQQAQERFRQWLASNSWFRPGDLKSARIAEKLRGVYLPFWAFSMLAQSRWSGSIGEYWYRTETYTTTVNGKTVTRTRRVRETEWWPLSGKHHRYYSAYLVSGSRGLPQQYAQRIKPFHLPALKRYEPFYLAGWIAEEYSVEQEDALQRSQQEFYRRERDNVAGFLPGDTHRDLRVETSFSHVASDLILLPVYLLSYRYRDKVYRFLLNGQTGKAAGDKPVSGKRIAVVVVAGLLPVAAVALVIALSQR